MFRRLSFQSVSSLLVLCACTLATPHATANSQNELKGVTTEISRQQAALKKQQQKLDKLQKSLKSQELKIAKVEREIRSSKKALTRTKANIAKLVQQTESLEAQQKQQTEQLKQLIQTYYVTQRAKSTSHLFKQSADQDRISHYFQHLAKARSETLAELQSITEKLAHSRRQLELEKEQQAAILNTQSQEKAKLTRAQKSRTSTLSAIRKDIKSDKSYLAELQRNETRLKAEIAKAAKRNAVPMNGLGKQRGRLPWPIKGKVLHNFGTRQTGQIDWKGMVISARYGQKVQSVYPGTVVFSEYLRGYGLVVLIDHGKGDMTLYGYNQTLLKKEGDKVTAGETIALAGDTGGQERASLYFEIRRNSEAQNPKRWLSR